MSKESAAKFVEAWEAGDSEVIKALEVQDEEVLLDPEALARVAGGIGFNATADELFCRDIRRGPRAGCGRQERCSAMASSMQQRLRSQFEVCR